MDNTDKHDKPTEPMFDEAAEWAALAQSGSLKERQAAALQRWLDTDKRHRIAYARMQRLLELTAGMGVSTPAIAAKEAPRRQRRRWSRTGFGIAAGLAMALFVAARLLPITSQSFVTDPGERLTVALADGSSVTLRGDSRLRANFGLFNRHITIDRGEAAFDVAHRRLRDFVVDSADVRVVALGTVFNVQVVDGRSTVTLLDGSVEVDDPEPVRGDAPSSADKVVLAPGQQVVFASDGSRSGVRQADIAQVTAWQDGRIVLRRRPLSELVDELNRSFRGQIRIEDPAVSDIPVNVSMQLADRETTLMRLEQQLPITFERLASDRFVVHRRTERR